MTSRAITPPSLRPPSSRPRSTASPRAPAESARPLRAPAPHRARHGGAARRHHRRRRCVHVARPRPGRAASVDARALGRAVAPGRRRRRVVAPVHRDVAARQLGAPRWSTATRCSCSAASARRSSARCATSSPTSRAGCAAPSPRRSTRSKPASRSAPRAPSWACSARSSSSSSCVAAPGPRRGGARSCGTWCSSAPSRSSSAFSCPMVDNAAHVGGMIGGGAMALIVAPGGLIGRSTAARALARRARAPLHGRLRLGGRGDRAHHPRAAPSSSASRRRWRRPASACGACRRTGSATTSTTCSTIPFLVEDGLMLPSHTPPKDPELERIARAHCQERSFALRMNS